VELTVDSRPRATRLARARPWVAVIVAAIIFALIPVLGLQLFFVVPLIGLVLAAGGPPDYVADAKTVDRRPRNLVLGIVVLICVALVVLQPQLILWLVVTFGIDAAGLVVAIIAVASLALPLAMADSTAVIKDMPQSRVVLTRRNLILCLTVAVTVAVWYAGPGLSYLAIAALVVGLPIPLALSRLLAARRDRLDLGLLRQPFSMGAARAMPALAAPQSRGNLLPHRLQFLNMLVLCGLLAFTLFTARVRRRSLWLLSQWLPGLPDRIPRWLAGPAACCGRATQACAIGIEPANAVRLSVHRGPDVDDLPASSESGADRIPAGR